MGKSKNTSGFKLLIQFLIIVGTFIATVYFSFSGVNHVIHWITSGFESHDLRLILVILLWFFSGGTVLAISIVLGLFFGTMVSQLFGWNSY